jgi:hypothetical protein
MGAGVQEEARARKLGTIHSSSAREVWGRGECTDDEGLTAFIIEI